MRVTRPANTLWKNMPPILFPLLRQYSPLFLISCEFRLSLDSASTLRAMLGSFHCRKRMLCCLSVPFVPDLFVSGSLRAAQCCSWSLLLSSALFVEWPSEEDVFSPDIVKNCNLDHALVHFISPLMPYPAIPLSGDIRRHIKSSQSLKFEKFVENG